MTDAREREQEREHKRVRQACANCRRKKARCSGERPVCAFCARLDQPCRYSEDPLSDDFAQRNAGPLSQENSRLAARVALLETRLSLLDANTDLPPASVAFGSSSGQRSNAFDGQGHAVDTNSLVERAVSERSRQAAAVGSQQVLSNFASLLDFSVLQSLAEVYFRYCHQQPYAYFDEATFRQSLNEGSLPSHLLFAFAATAVRFSSEPCFAGRQAAAMDSFARLAWSNIMEQSFSDNQGPTVSTVQAVNMLAIGDFIAGRNQVAWVKIGLSVRLAQTLQLGKDPDPQLSRNTAEERSLTFWSVYFLDKLVSCGRDRPPGLLDVDCKVQLPTNPCSVQSALNSEPPTLAVVQDIPDTPPLKKSDHFALSIFMVSTLGHVARWAFRQGASDPRLPWDPRSEFARINGMLLSFESYSDACDGNFEAVFGRHFVSHGVVDERMSCHFTYSHIVFHLNQCLLHHPFLLRQNLRNFKAKVPSAFLRGATLKSKEHAIRIAEILRTLQERGCESYPSFYAYVAVIAGVIIGLHSADPSSPGKEETKVRYNLCLSFLEHKPVRWKSYTQMSNHLRDFKPTASLAKCLLSSTFDRTLLKPDVEEALWQLCDYSWLASSARLTSITKEVSQSEHISPEPAATTFPRAEDSPDFDTLLRGALSLDYSLLNDFAGGCDSHAMYVSNNSA